MYKINQLILNLRFHAISIKKHIKPQPLQTFVPRKPARYHPKYLNFTQQQIINFDFNYYVKKTISKVNLKSKNPFYVQQYKHTDIIKLLQNKIQCSAQLSRFILLRKSNMKIPQLSFVVRQSEKLEYVHVFNKQVIGIIENVIKNQDKIPVIHLKSILRFSLLFEIKEQIIEKILENYLEGQKDKQFGEQDIDMILNCSVKMILKHKKLILKMGRQDLSIGHKIFMFFCFKKLLNDEQIVLFDQYFSEHFTKLESKKALDILRSFSAIQKKGLFIQLFSNHLQTYQPKFILNHILVILVQFKKLNHLTLQQYRILQPFLIEALMNHQFKIMQISLLIQILHQSALGSLQLWQLMKSLSIKYEFYYNELFGILSGFERNLYYDNDLFIELIQTDPQQQAIKVLKNEDDFLKLMIVYYCNYSKLQKQSVYKDVIGIKINKTLSELYSTSKYKIFIILFQMLFQNDPEIKKQSMYRLHLDQNEKLLFSLLDQTQQETEFNQQLISFMRQSYFQYDLHKERYVIVEFIRQRKIKFQQK